MPTIANPKAIQKKSKSHRVTRTGHSSFDVLSGNSGETYHVSSDGHSGTCSCRWASYRPVGDSRSACSHVLAVLNFISEQNNRKVSAWSNEPQASKQHRPMAYVGDGVFVTSRKAA